MTSLIKVPNRYDILCGKGKECNGSEGSQRYRLVIDSFREKYAKAANRHKKCAITLQIYDLLSKTSSRFLKYNEEFEAWEELPFMTARDKIGHALRFANRKSAKKGSASSSNGSQSSSSAGVTAASTASVTDTNAPIMAYSSLPMTTGSMVVSNSSRSRNPHQAQNEPQGNHSNTMDATKFLNQARQVAAQNRARQIITAFDPKRSNNLSAVYQHPGSTFGQSLLSDLLHASPVSKSITGLLRYDDDNGSAASCQLQKKSPISALQAAAASTAAAASSPMTPVSSRSAAAVGEGVPIHHHSTDLFNKTDCGLEQAREYLRLAFNGPTSSSSNSASIKGGSDSDSSSSSSSATQDDSTPTRQGFC